ncbi:MAG: hypothetical protein R2751_10345, partial [Bacteroidales bacterium]
MKKSILLFFAVVSMAAQSQVLPEEEFTSMVKLAQESCEGAHESVLKSLNQEFSTAVVGKVIRLNTADVVRFIQRSSGEKVTAGVDLTGVVKAGWVYEQDQKVTSELLKKQGIQVTTSFNTLWIKANQPMVYIENKENGHKTLLELYCPTQEVLAGLRTGKQQSIEFL